MKYASHNTQHINESDVTLIKAKGCFKLDVRNDSSGTILVNLCPIESGETKPFDGLPPGVVFATDFQLDQTDVISPDIYVTRYFYTDDPEKCTPIDHFCK